LLVALLLVAFSFVAQAAPLKVGITQIVEHPALDKSRQGFIDRLTELGYVEGTDIVYDIQSAQGDMATAQTIARKFQSDGVDLVLAIATPTAQAAAHVIKDTPILITAVTEPVAAGLVESIARPGTNVTGTSDLTPVKAQLELLKEIVPHATRVGVIYNAGEINSVVQVDIAKEAAAELGLTIVEATAGNSSEVLQAAQSLQGRVDAIYVPKDNTVVAALESVLQVGIEQKIPVFAGETDSVERGALASYGLDYFQLGYKTGMMAVDILQNGVNPGDIPVGYPDDLGLVINADAAAKMGVTITDSMRSKAEAVINE